MMSMSVQANITCPSSSSRTSRTQFSAVKHRASTVTTVLGFKNRPFRRALKISATAALEAPPTQEPQKSEVGVKKVSKPRLVLKFIWMEKNIGLALDQELPGHGTVPLSPYYFWPRKDAWEELKSTLESKPWISQKEMIILLNQATDIINLWQQSGGNLSS